MISRVFRPGHDTLSFSGRNRSVRFHVYVNLQGPFKHDSAKTSAARTSTCLSVKRLSVADVIRFYKKLNKIREIM